MKTINAITTVRGNCDFSLFCSLSIEVVAEIFSYLDKDSKLASRSVCRDWKFILDTHFLEFHGIVCDSNLNNIKNSGVEFETLTITNLFLPIPPEPGTMSRNKLALSPTKLIFKPRHYDCSNSNNNDLLFPQSSIVDENISKMIVYNRNAKEIIFKKNSLQSICSLDVGGLLLKHLQHLDISLSDEMCFQEEYVLFQLGSMKTPSLNKLILDSTKVALVYDEWHAMRHYMNLFKFISQHQALKSLEFRYFYRQLLHYVDSNERPLPLTEKQLNVVKENLSQIKLKEFNFRFTRQEGSGPYNLGAKLLSLYFNFHANIRRQNVYSGSSNFKKMHNTFFIGFHLLSHQRCLENLEAHVPSGVEFGSLYHEIHRCIERNTETLTHFCIHQYILMPGIEEIQSIMEALTKCPRLESLQLFLYSISTFPYKLSKALKKLTLLGNLRPCLLLDIKCAFPNLEYLEFSNMTSVVGRAREELRNNLKLVLQMPSLKCVKWYVDGFDMNFLSDFPGITVKRISKNIFIFMIVIT